MSHVVLGAREWFYVPFFNHTPDDHELTHTIMIALPVNLSVDPFHLLQVFRSSELMHLSPSIIKNALSVVIKSDILLPSNGSCWPLFKVCSVLRTATTLSHDYKCYLNLL